MANIKVTMRDGKVQEFNHQGRAGGSWTKRVRYEPGFVIVVDEWSNETAIPTELVERVEVDAETRGGW